jgi:hypothetical protein
MAAVGSAPSSLEAVISPSSDNDCFGGARFESRESRSSAFESITGCYHGLAYITATRHHLWPSLTPKDATTWTATKVPTKSAPTRSALDNSDEKENLPSSPSESTTIHVMSSMIIMAESERDHKMISCIHGCGVQVLSSYQDDHSTLCSHAPVTCQWDGCNQIMTRHQYRYHIAWCDYAFLDCPSCTPLMPHWPLQVSRQS